MNGDPMKDFHRLMQRANIKSAEEFNAFLEEMNNTAGLELDDEELTEQEQAEDLVAEAYEMSRYEGNKLIQEALRIDKDCIDAYIYLATTELRKKKGLAFAEQGVAIGRRLFGGTFLEESKGHFWGIYETRPFMRCMSVYAELLLDLGQMDEGIAVFEEMLELNQTDNLGVRNVLFPLFLECNNLEKYEIHYKKYKEEKFSAFAAYTNLLYHYKKSGNTKTAHRAFVQAHKLNRFIGIMILEGNMPDISPDMYAIGTEEEANVYLSIALPAWYADDTPLKLLFDEIAKL